MAANLASVTALTKEMYTEGLQDQINSEVTLFKRIEQTSEHVDAGGRYVTFPIRVRRNQGIGYRNENEALPAAGQQGFARPQVPLKYGYGSVRISAQTMKLVDNQRQAFVSAMDEEMQDLKTDIVKDTGRIAYGDGTGTLGVLTTLVAGNQYNTTSAKYFEIGQIVDVLAPGGGTTRSSANTVTAVDRTVGANKVTFQSALTGFVANDIVTRTGNYGREPNGMLNIVNNNAGGYPTLHGLSDQVEPLWAAVTDTNGGASRAISEGLMIQMCDNVFNNGGKTTAITASLGVRRSYFNLLTQQRQFPSTTKFTGGFTGLAFNYGDDIPVVADVDAPDQTMIGINEAALKMYVPAGDAGNWNWMEETGSMWTQYTDTNGRYDAFQATLRRYYEVGTNRRNTHWALRNITEG